MVSKHPAHRVMSIVAVTVAFFTLLTAVLGLSYNTLTMYGAFAGVFEKLPQAETLPYFKPAFFVMSGVCVACYLILIYCAVQLFRGCYRVSRLLVLILLFEVGFFYAVGSMWHEPTIGSSVAAATGVATGGLMIQFIIVLPIWAPIALWLSGMFAVDDTSRQTPLMRPIGE